MHFLLYYAVLFLRIYLITNLSLYALSLKIPLAAFLARLMAGFACIMVCAAYGGIVSIVLRPLGQQRIAQWVTARAFKFAMLFTTGVTFKVEDPHNYLKTTRPAVLIGNHQTELDILMLGCVFPKYCSVTAKKQLKRWPILGWFMILSGTVFIDRANPTNARSAMASAADEIKNERQNVYMFPEGTRNYSKEPSLLPFKKGAFHLAVQAGVPIIPVVAANYSDVLYLQNRHFRSGTILCKVLKPIETKHLTSADVDDLTRDTRELMLKEITLLTERQRGQAVPVEAQNGNGKVLRASGVKATPS